MKRTRTLFAVAFALVLGLAVVSRYAEAQGGSRRGWVLFGYCYEGCSFGCDCTILPPVIIT